MSGHSKWSQIKRKKEITDKKKSQIFSKILKNISISAREGTDPQFNPKLRSFIEKARENNIPSDNIERAINKSKESSDLKELIVEFYGPEGTSFIIQGATDNSNRTIGEIKNILSDFNIKIADPGSVVWSFKKENNSFVPNYFQKISEQTKEKISEIIEALDDQDDVLEIYTNADYEN